MENVYYVTFFFFGKKDIIKIFLKIMISFKFLKALSSKIVIIYIYIYIALENISIILANMHA